MPAVETRETLQAKAEAARQAAARAEAAVRQAEEAEAQERARLADLEAQREEAHLHRLELGEEALGQLVKALMAEADSIEEGAVEAAVGAALDGGAIDATPWAKAATLRLQAKVIESRALPAFDFRVRAQRAEAGRRRAMVNWSGKVPPFCLGDSKRPRCCNVESCTPHFTPLAPGPSCEAYGIPRDPAGIVRSRR